MYNHNLIEKKWQKYWEQHHIFKFVDSTKPKYYVLDMFPYPSGAGLHVGHLKGYTATDIVARYKKMKGFDVLHPIGWDAFGLPAEQYALQTGNHPESFTTKNINAFREELKMMGFCYDYDKEVNTTDPQYYKWTQWIFSKLFEHQLAEIRDIEVNWCEKLGTVLANEEVLNVNGQMVSERGSFPVIKKPMKQWVLKITQYADKLLEGLDEISWPESLKSIQRSWIGKSIGAKIKFKTTIDETIEVFTTRPDTIYGVTFICVAPEHPLVNKLTTAKFKKTVDEYITKAKSKTDLQRKELEKSKTGIFTGSYAINPITEEKIPIYVADYVLVSYASGIVMGVPAHDSRDFAFATKYDLPIKFVIQTSNQNQAYEDDGVHINSPLIDGLNNEQAQNKIVDYLIKHKIGTRDVSYKLKDWIFSRQRYWGEPFPIIFDEKHVPHLVKDLPVLLPKVEKIQLSTTGESPLANLKDWVNVKVGTKNYHRETNTMPQWAGSCWYYIGYLIKCAHDKYLDLDDAKAKKILDKWLPVDLYVGGQEHAVLHLLYARFWHRFLYDIGLVSTKEPFQLILNQGMILGPDGDKMSKSKGNVVTPSHIIKTHGADALRVYESFMGPLTASMPWIESGLDGSRKWLDKVYRLLFDSNIKLTNDESKIDEKLNVAFHKFIKQVSEDIENFSFNVAISHMMIYINECYLHDTLYIKHLEGFTQVLSCFAPHLAEEIWSTVLKSSNSIFMSAWPTYDKNKIIESTITLPVQENGKLRTTIIINKDAEQKEVEKIAYQDEKVIKFIANRQPKKVIYVKNRILNFIM